MFDIPTLSDDELESELCSHQSHITVAECKLVLLIAELDRRGTWVNAGVRSCAHWLNWRVGTSLSTAREQVRVGRRLAELPLVREAFSKGEVSYSKVRAITRVANTDLEANFLELAQFATAAQLEQIVRSYRVADPDEGKIALGQRVERSFSSYVDEDGMLVIRARLSLEDGAVVLAAIEAANRATRDSNIKTPRVSPKEPLISIPHTSDKNVSAETFSPTTFEMDRADGLVAACESALRSQSKSSWSASSPVTNVIVHVDQDVLLDPLNEGCSYIEGLGAISAHTAQRLACDSQISKMEFSSSKTPQPGKTSRNVSKRLRKAILMRDNGCRWPGCTQSKYVDLHHVVFWSKGGPTIPSNLVTLCRTHHRLVHEGGFCLQMPIEGKLIVIDPKGVEIPTYCPLTSPLGPELEEAHDNQGLDISDETLWYGGERFDLGLTIDALLSKAGKI